MSKSINWFPTGRGIPNALSNASSMVSGDYAALPANLQSIPGIVGFVGSSYENPLPGREVTTLGMVYALRTDGTTTKAYEFSYGINAGGTHVMGGNNFKSHPYHHVTSPSFNWSQVFGTSPDGNPW
jgi:hypothetical protein